VKVWDPAVRIFHWTLATAFAAAWLSEDAWSWLHVNAGYLIGGLILFRVLWGFVGPTHARFRNFVKRPRDIRSYVRQMIRLKAPRHLGHNPAGGAMILALLATLMLTIASGMALYGATDFAGPLAGIFRGDLAADMLEAPHAFGANAPLFLIALHLGGVLFSSLAHRENLVRSMVNGRKKENP